MPLCYQLSLTNLLVLTVLMLCGLTVRLLQIVHDTAIDSDENETRHQTISEKALYCETRPHIVNGTSTIRAYLSRVEHPEDWVLLKWNPDGSFDATRAQTKTLYKQWAPSAELLGSTGPSGFGRVVLLFNSDRLPQVRWDIRPPVPVWVYSKPISTVDPRRHNISEKIEPCILDRVSMVPSAYDTGTWNWFCVEQVDRKMTKRNFTEKINQVIWRGAVHSPRVEQSRVALLEYSRKLSTETTKDNNNNNNDWLNVHEVNKKEDPHHMEIYELADYRYHLDLGGVSGTAWGGLRWKLCSGLLVFKVDSWSNDWWYETLEPWIHYIPIRADIGDLHEQYQWTQKHPEEAMAIAEAGRKQCWKSFGPEVALASYRAAVQNIPEAGLAIATETDEILEQLIRLDTDLAGLSSIASSTS